MIEPILGVSEIEIPLRFFFFFFWFYRVGNYVVWYNYNFIEFLGPACYQCDQGYFQKKIYSIVDVGLAENQILSNAKSKIPTKFN